MTASGDQINSLSMTCNWDKSWTPGHEILDCDWVACVQPPQPPGYANMRVNNWFGDPIQFGEKVMFVCERGMKFENEPSKEYEEYQCQNGSLPGSQRGYFIVPEKDMWPRCITGRYDTKYKVSIRLNFYIFPVLFMMSKISILG